MRLPPSEGLQHSSNFKQKMKPSQLHFSIVLLGSAMTLSIISCARSHLVLSSDGSPADDEMRDRYSLQEIKWILSNSEPAAVHSDSLELLQNRLDLMRRDSGDKERKPGCKNYFWKSRTAC